MKKILKTILLVISWILAFFFCYIAIYGLVNSDPWGLTFAVITLPCGILSIIFLSLSISLTKKYNKK
jgi:hypothetical protein